MGWVAVGGEDGDERGDNKRDGQWVNALIWVSQTSSLSLGAVVNIVGEI